MGATLFTSCRPCIMCLGAAHWARLSEVVSAALKGTQKRWASSEGAGTEQLRAEMEARGVVFLSGYLREGAHAIPARRYDIRGLPIYGPKPD